MGTHAKVFATRSDVGVSVHAGTGAYAKLEKGEHRWHGTSERFARREQYHELLATTDVAAYESWDEGVNGTVREMLA
jgi:hypothetical protein